MNAPAPRPSSSMAVKKSMSGMGMSHWIGRRPLHKFPNNVMIKKNPHLGASEMGWMGEIGGANRVRNHEPYKMKIHPRKKLPTFFPYVLFCFPCFPFVLFKWAKRRAQKALSGRVSACVCVCALGWVNVFTCVFVCLWVGDEDTLWNKFI